MNVEFKAPEARVVAAKPPGDADGTFGPALYAVLTDTPEQAEAAVQDLVAPETTVEVAPGTLASETAERLALVPGEAKQIG